MNPSRTDDTPDARCVVRRAVLASWLTALLVAIGACAKAPPPAATVAGHAERPADNAVQREMRLLDAAMRDSVTAIGAGDVRGLPARLHAVHEAAEETDVALEHGAYKLPRNADRLAEFVELDEAFHRELTVMATAASQNDLATTALQLGALMNRCQGCHVLFRAEARP
jgi:cytochrome c556